MSHDKVKRDLTAAELNADPRVRAIYLGGSTDEG